nr:hypothetical protein [Tanacetum cinerariifolium]
MNYQPVVAGNQPNSSAGIQEHFDANKVEEGHVQQYVLFPLRSTGSKDPQNTDADATFEVKEPKSEVHVSLSSSAKAKKHDDKTKREAKEKRPVDTPVTTVGLYFANSTNTFSAAGPTNTATCQLWKTLLIQMMKKIDENDVHVSISRSDNTDNKKQDEKAKRDAKGKSLVDSPTGVQDLRVEFDEFSFNNSNMVNAVSASVTAVGPNLTNSTNSFNTASPSVNDISPSFRIARKSLFVDPFKYPDDPDLPELEGIGHTQEEGIDYDEVFALIARIKAIWLFLAFASFMGFMVYQMEVKRAFLYGTVEEEVYVCQPLGFKDPDYSDKELCKAFEKMIKDKFKMSSKGELTFFLGLLVKQKDDGIFSSQDKYVAKILRKFSFIDVKSASTHIETKKPLLNDPD